MTWRLFPNLASDNMPDVVSANKMVVVADTTPLRYLIVMGRQGLFPALFGQIRIPRMVLAELSASGTPPEVAAFARAVPEWRRVEDVRVELMTAIQARLDPGEREALALPCELGADLVVMDDAQGRREAAVLGLGVIGTVGLLRLAVERGLADASEVIEDLGRTNFYFSADLLRNAFAEWL